MTTKSPTSTCGAYWGLCLPRSRIAVWLASRPSTTSVASMTCQVRAISPGLGEYVRTALVSSVGRRDGWWFRLTENGRRCDTRAPAGLRAPADDDTSPGGALPPQRGGGRAATRPAPPYRLRSVVRPVVGHRRQRVGLALAVPGGVAAVARALLRGAAL